MTTYTVTLIKAEVAAMEYCDAFSWQSYYENNAEPHEGLLDEQDISAEDWADEVAMAAASSYTGNVLTLVADSHLEADVLHMLETKTEGFDAVITGPAR